MPRAPTVAVLPSHQSNYQAGWCDEGVIRTSRLAIIDAPNESGVIRKIQAAMERYPEVADASIVEVDDHMTLADHVVLDIERNDMAVEEKQQVIIGDPLWPGLMQALIEDSAGVVAAHGCPLNVRTDSNHGVLAESLVASEVHFLGRLGVNITDGTSAYRRPLIDARQFSLMGINDDAIIDTIIDDAMSWATLGMGYGRPWFEYIPLPSHPTVDGTCQRHVEAAFAFAENSVCMVGPRQPPPNSASASFIHPPHWQPMVELKVQYAGTFQRGGDMLSPIVDTAQPDRRDRQHTRSPSAASLWLDGYDEQPYRWDDDDDALSGIAEADDRTIGEFLSTMAMAGAHSSIDAADDRTTEDAQSFIDGADDSRSTVTTQDPRSELVDAGGGGQGHATAGMEPVPLGHTVAGVGPPANDGLPEWVVDCRGDRSESITLWYNSLRGHGCDEASVMGFVALAQYNPDAYRAARDVVDAFNRRAVEVPPIDNPSGKLWNMVLGWFHRLRPEGKQHAGMAGT